MLFNWSSHPKDKNSTAIIHRTPVPVACVRHAPPIVFETDHDSVGRAARRRFGRRRARHRPTANARHMWRHPVRHRQHGRPRGGRARRRVCARAAARVDRRGRPCSPRGRAFGGAHPVWGAAALAADAPASAAVGTAEPLAPARAAAAADASGARPAGAHAQGFPTGTLPRSHPPGSGHRHRPPPLRRGARGAAAGGTPSPPPAVRGGAPVARSSSALATASGRSCPLPPLGAPCRSRASTAWGPAPPFFRRAPLLAPAAGASEPTPRGPRVALVGGGAGAVLPTAAVDASLRLVGRLRRRVAAGTAALRGARGAHEPLFFLAGRRRGGGGRRADPARGARGGGGGAAAGRPPRRPTVGRGGAAAGARLRRGPQRLPRRPALRNQGLAKWLGAAPNRPAWRRAAVAAPTNGQSPEASTRCVGG